MIMMSLLWIISVLIKNAGIVDIFWGLGFIAAAVFYFYKTGDPTPRKILIVTIVTIWGIRLSAYIAWRNHGKGEDFRYRNFRQNFGEKRYWWFSFFQVFMLQGTLMWLISAPLLGAQFYSQGSSLNFFDYSGIVIWIIGFLFEAGGDYQLAAFKSDEKNRGKILDKGFWKYTRHPNYFGDSAAWWGYGLICIAAGSYLPFLGVILMTALIIKISGVALLEKSLADKKPGYNEYIARTNAFIPWFPKK